MAEAIIVGEMRREKKAVALNSIFAAVAITVLKVVVGVTTGSLGILSEAAHSGLDLVAAVITYFSVRVSDKPADAEHQYGHGKVENFSAFLETGLLLLTCVWIVYEATQRLFFHAVHIQPTLWAFAGDGRSPWWWTSGARGACSASRRSMTARRFRPMRSISAPTSGRARWSFSAWRWLWLDAGSRALAG